MRTADARNAIAKTTIGKYFASNATTMPRTQTAQQVWLLLTVLLQASAPPGKGVSRRLVEEYFRCWKGLLTSAPKPAHDPAAPAATPVPIAEPVLALSLDVDHEAELRELDEPAPWANLGLSRRRSSA